MGLDSEVRYVASRRGHITYVYVFRYRLGIAMDATVVKVGL